VKKGKPWKEKLDFNYNGVEVYTDKYPVTDGHLLFVPDKATDCQIRCALDAAWDYGSKRVASGDWEAFNIGMNYGKAAGQTVEYPHIHLIPRTEGDMDEPAGGVRGVIPSKQKY